MTDATLQAARESFSGKTMTETQLRKTAAIADILHAEIQRSGSFKEPLTDYAHAFARGEKFDALRGETMIRDVYAAKFGKTMNQAREGLIAAEKALPAHAKTRALACAESIEGLIQALPTQPFYMAYDRAGTSLAQEFGITQVAAKTMIKEAYQEHHGRDLYEHGKQVEDLHHRPVREAEIAARQADPQPARGMSRSQG